MEQVILNSVCTYFGVSREDVLNKDISRQKIVYPRKIIAYLLSEQHMKRTLIGVFLHTGERTKVIYYIKKIQDMIDIGDKRVIQDIQTIREMVGGEKERAIVHVNCQRVEILYQVVEKKINIKDIYCKNVVSLLQYLGEDNLNKLSNLIQQSHV